MEMKRKFSILGIVFALLIVLSTAGIVLTHAADAIVIDPAFNLIGGAEGDMAILKDDGTVDLNITPTAGFGFRANMSNCSEAGMVDVKNFTTTFTLRDVPVNVTTIFALQTVSTGTIGGGNGNAINIMLRKDEDKKVAVAIYNAQASEPAIWAPGHLDLGDDYKVTITYDYTSANPIVLGLKESYPLPEADFSLRAHFDTHYNASGYKGYYSLSSYYFTAPTSIKAEYTVNTINNSTPKAFYKEILEEKVTTFETAVNALTATSTKEEIEDAGALDIFAADSTFGKLLAIVDVGKVIETKIETTRTKYAGFFEIVMSDTISKQIAAFDTALTNCDINKEADVLAVIVAYEAIDRVTIATLSVANKDKLNTELQTVTAKETFKTIIQTKTDKYIKEYEGKLTTGDAASLQTYKDIAKIVKDWAEYKTENYVETTLTQADVTAFNARIVAISDKLKSSLYKDFWTEGDTWNAIKSDKGLFATGEGKYFETLGFNQKLEVGKDAKVIFNVAYALRVLGSNQLHIGFYPEKETGTKGSSDGVRVDFWFSAAGTVEIKPVNGKTETKIYTGAFLSIVDSGMFDMDAEVANYEVGKYDVELTKDNSGKLMLKVNGQELDIDLDSSIFNNGCYMTVSAMSVAGAEKNEILITQVGSKSYIGDGKVIDDTEPNDNTIFTFKNIIITVVVIGLIGGGVVAALQINKKRKVK